MLTHIALKNFRLYREASIPLRKVNFVAGLNGAGKSSLLDAISVLLSGSCESFESGRSLSTLRTIGSARRWQISGAWQADGAAPAITLTRTEGDGPRSDVQKEIEAAIGVSPDVVRACLYSGELARLSAKDRQRLIFALAAPEAIVLDDTTVGLIEDTIGGALPSYSIAQLDAAYKSAYERRREVNRALKALGQPMRVALPDGFAAQWEAASVDKIRAAVRTLRDKIAGIEAERDQKAQIVSGATRKAERLEDTRKGLAQRIARLEEQTSGEQDKIAGGTRGVLARHKALRQTREALAERLDQITKDLAAIDAEGRQTRAAMDAIDPESAECPTCGAEMSRELAASRHRSLELRLADLRTKHRIADGV